MPTVEEVLKGLSTPLKKDHLVNEVCTETAFTLMSEEVRQSLSIGDEVRDAIDGFAPLAPVWGQLGESLTPTKIPKAFDASGIGMNLQALEQESEALAPEPKAPRQTIKDILGNDFDPRALMPVRRVTEEFSQFILDSNSISQNIIAYDIAMFTKFRDEVRVDNNPNNDVNLLENVRLFSNGSMKSRGICYSAGPLELMNAYPCLQQTSVLYQPNEDLFTDRYIYPICLPDGKVYCHMGYHTGVLLESIQRASGKQVIRGLNDMNPDGKNKYQIAGSPWVNQGNLLGNMESLGMYDGEVIFCVEGYLDALRINDEFGYKSLAILNSTLTVAKLRILNELKNQGHYLVYIPDMDNAGLSTIIKHRVWDDVYTLPTLNLGRINSKDIDNYVKSHYLAEYYKNEDVNLDAVMADSFNIHDTVKVQIPFYQVSLKAKLEVASRILKGGFR